MDDMLLFADTEFTDFIDSELLSIALVSSDGKSEFYAEITDYNPKACSEFVKEEVLPLFDGRGFVGTRKQVAFKISDWLIDLPYEKVTIVIDYFQDWDHLTELLAVTKRAPPMKLRKLPEYVQNMTDFATQVAMQGFEEYYTKFGAKRHHALDDARANRYGWLQAMKTLY